MRAGVCDPGSCRVMRVVLGALISVLLLRFVGLGLLPLSDPSEARYVAIAQSMVRATEWITPRFPDGTPLMGKPPLHFWVTAATLHLFRSHRVCCAPPERAGRARAAGHNDPCGSTMLRSENRIARSASGSDDCSWTGLLGAFADGHDACSVCGAGVRGLCDRLCRRSAGRAPQRCALRLLPGPGSHNARQGPGWGRDEDVNHGS